MAAIKNYESGAQGTIIALDAYFRVSPGGDFADDDGYESSGTLPRVRIYDPSGAVVVDTDASDPPAVRNSRGEYEYFYAIPLGAEVSDQWVIQWDLTINTQAAGGSERFSVTPEETAPVTEFTKNTETRSGFKFDNPDLTSDIHYPGWGSVVTPDELRFLTLGGTKLLNPETGYTFDDKHIYAYIKQALARVERDFDIHILPRKVRFPGTFDENNQYQERQEMLDARAEVEAALGPRRGEVSKFVIPDNGYDYVLTEARYYLYVKLNYRPLREIHKWTWVGPVSNAVSVVNQTIIEDLRPYMKHYRPGAPDWESAVQAFIGPSVLVSSVYPYAGTYFGQFGQFEDYPDAFLFDYDTGMNNAAEVPDDLRDLIYFLSALFILEAFSDAKSPGLASASVSLNSISESYSTTQSATNSLYGAQRAYIMEHITNWMKANSGKYRRSPLGVL